MNRTSNRSATAVALLALTAAACGQDGAARRDADAVPRDVAATLTPATLETSTTDLGEILVDGSGRTLYMFTEDVESASACGQDCVAEWPVLDAPDAHTGRGAVQMLVSTTERADGTEQITYHEHPLYYFAGDDAVGDTEGHGLTAFGGTWLVLRPGGTPVRP